METHSYVLVYDSGIGGLTTLASCALKVKNAKFLYYADIQNLPYGNKSINVLQNLILSNIKDIQSRYNISHIILACNTATTSSIEYLRNKINIPIIGTEPNIKEPIIKGYDNITLLATPLTITQKKLLNLENQLNIKPKHISSKLLAKTIENYKLTGDKKYLKIALKLSSKALLKTPKNSAVVLGCTHYVFIKKQIEKMGYKCYDGNMGVSLRFKSLYISQSINYISPRIKFYGLDKITQIKYKKIFLNYYNQLKKEQS